MCNIVARCCSNAVFSIATKKFHTLMERRRSFGGRPHVSHKVFRSDSILQQSVQSVNEICICPSTVLCIDFDRQRDVLDVYPS